MRGNHLAYGATQGRNFLGNIINSLYLTKYYHKSNYVSMMFFKIILVQSIFRFATALKIPKERVLDYNLIYGNIQ